MREMKSYRDPYTDIKRSSAISGPYRSIPRGDHIAGIILAIAVGIGFTLAILF